ncbi:MAG TPA: dihydrofolate reductase family protein, partial [Nitriliruptorales bacterium]
GVQRLLCEGGPRLSGQLVSQGLADELFLTIAPVLVGADGPRLVEGADVARRLEVLALHEHGGDLLLRLRVGPSLQR